MREQCATDGVDRIKCDTPPTHTSHALGIRTILFGARRRRRKKGFEKERSSTNREKCMRKCIMCDCVCRARNSFILWHSTLAGNGIIVNYYYIVWPIETRVNVVCNFSCHNECSIDHESTWMEHSSSQIGIWRSYVAGKNYLRFSHTNGESNIIFALYSLTFCPRRLVRRFNIRRL